MAVYTNDLRLKEIATGDEAGTWGNSTNTNLQLIADAFGFGTEAITTNADTHTTTIADGSADPGRSIFLKYTGTLDSACTITIGPNTVSKLWFIENATSGSQNIIIKQGSGATVTIPAGDTKAIYSDGAGSGGAMVDAFTDLNVAGTFTADGGVKVDNITIDGTEIDLSSGDLTIDVAGGITLDADDSGTISFKDDGTRYGVVQKDSNNFEIVSMISDGDLVIKGNDGGSTITALTLDMSAAGKAIFNAGIVVNESGGDNNTRFEGDSNTSLLEIDASADKIGVGTSAPSGLLHVYNGTLQVGSKTGDTSIQQNANAIRIAAVPNSSTEWGGLQWYREFSDVIGCEIIAARASSAETDTDLIFKTSTNSSNAVEVMRIDHDGTVFTKTAAAGTAFKIESSDSGATVGPGLVLYRNSSNSADDDVLGSITFEGKNDAGQDVAFAQIRNDLKDASDGVEDGLLDFQIMANGTSRSFLLFNGGGTIVANQDSRDIDFRIETDLNADALVVNSGDNCVVFGSQVAENRVGQQFAVTSAGHRGGMCINSFFASASGPILDFQVSRNSNAGSHTVVQDGDALGTLIFRGDDGDEFKDSVAIEANVDGTPSNNNMPGELRFLTTADSSGLQEHMVIKSDGKVGIGTNTPAYQFEVSNSGNSIMRMSAGTSGSASIRLQNDVAHWDVNAQTTDHFAIFDQANSRLPFKITAASAEVVINEDSSGSTDFRVETTAASHMIFANGGDNTVTFDASDFSAVDNATATGLAIRTAGRMVLTGTDGGNIIEFNISGTGGVGTIRLSGSNTQYNTSSDERLKENIADAEDAGELIDAIQVRQFDWKIDGEHQRYGMVAQELNTVTPEAVSVPDDPEKMQGVDYSKLVPMLVKEIQTLRARVAKLEGE